MTVFLPQVQLRSQNEEWEGKGRGTLWVKPQKMEETGEGSHKCSHYRLPGMGWGWKGMRWVALERRRAASAFRRPGKD